MWYKKHERKILIAVIAVMVMIGGVELTRGLLAQRAFNDLVQASNEVLPNDPDKPCILGAVAMANDDSTSAEKRAAVDAYYDCMASTTPIMATVTPKQTDPAAISLRPIWILWGVISMIIAFGGGYIIGLLD